MSEQLESFRDYWLEPARVPPPTVDFEFQEIAGPGDVVARARPVRAEEASWNQWPGSEARLFNNRAVYLFQVEVLGESGIVWLPDSSSLEANTPDTVLPVVRNPDEVLAPLLVAALQQERWVLEGDLVDRTRAAGPFRAAYMPTARQEHLLSGLVAFFKVDPEQHVVAMRLTLGVEVGGTAQDLVWVFD